MAFDSPPSILGGISHPQVITDPGNGAALAGGLSTVLAAFLQKNQLDQQHQEFQANIAQKQAETEQAVALAKKTGADTDYLKQQTKDLQDKSDQAKEQHTLMTQGLGFVASNSQALNDPKAWGQAITDGLQHGTIKPEHIPYLMDMAGKTAETMGHIASAQKGQSDATISAANAGVAGPMARADLAEKQAGAANTLEDAATKKQKLDDAEKQKYLLANDNDPMKAYSKYLMDKKLYGKAGASDPSLAMQFQALAKSPVDGLKPAQQLQVIGKFDKDVNDLKVRGSAMGAATASLKSAMTNPAAYGSAISKFVQAVDQDKNLRYQLLKYYEGNIDPQAPTLLSKFIDKNFQGKLPPKVAGDMYQHLMSMRQEYKGQYDARRQFYAEKYPEVADKFAPSDVYFGKDEDVQLGPTAATSSDPAQLWEQLVAGGMPKDAATAEVKKRLGQ